MDNYKIIDYSEKWRGKMRDYMHKIFPEYSDAYIEYCLDNSTGSVSSKVVVDGNGEVMGCHLYFNTKAIVNGEEINTRWGHDTFLNEKCRKEIGADFALMRRDIPTFGLGLTKINSKLSKLMKRVFIKDAYLYYMITPCVILSPFQKLFHREAKIKAKDIIRVKGHLFKRNTDVNEINIPNGGFWYKGYHDVDFIRDREFLERRFFKCNVHDYIVYSSGKSYFIVRKSTYRGMPAMMLSDFRYDPNEKDAVQNLMKAIRKLAIKSHVGIIRFVCGGKNIDEYMKGKLHHKTPLDFITSYKVQQDASYLLCGGDSDADFVHS